MTAPPALEEIPLPGDTSGSPTPGGTHTGGMLALMPTGACQQQMAVNGGTDPSELHLTLAFLGDDVTGWDDTQRGEITDLARRVADEAGDANGMIHARVFGYAAFNPDGFNDQDPCMVYLVGGSSQLRLLQRQFAMITDTAQYEPFAPHITAGPGSDVTAMTYTGPVVFDRIRVALAGDITDIPLGPTTSTVPVLATAHTPTPSKVPGGLDEGRRTAVTAAARAMTRDLGPAWAYAAAPLLFTTPELLTAAENAIDLPDSDPAIVAGAAPDLPPAAFFVPPPDLPPGTGHYVDGRRVYGRLAEWNVPHIGIDGKALYPPRSPSGYRWFHTKMAQVQGTGGPERIKVGHLTFGTGHAGLGVGHLAAAAHYDNSGFRGAKVRMSEDGHGIVYAGALVAGLEGSRLEEFSESDTSGDWRRILGDLELVAALCVTIGGFPKVGLSLAASGEPLALVAAAKSWGHPAAALDVEAFADAIVDRIGQRAALTARRDALLASLDDTPIRVAALLADLR